MALREASGVSSHSGRFFRSLTCRHKTTGARGTSRCPVASNENVVSLKDTPREQYPYKQDVAFGSLSQNCNLEGIGRVRRLRRSYVIVLKEQPFLAGWSLGDPAIGLELVGDDPDSGSSWRNGVGRSEPVQEEYQYWV